MSLLGRMMMRDNILCNSCKHEGSDKNPFCEDGHARVCMDYEIHMTKYDAAELRSENERLCKLVAGNNKDKKLLRGSLNSLFHFLDRKMNYQEDWDKEIAEEMWFVRDILRQNEGEIDG